MKILIISGFLGAGKTTFIKEMVRATKRDYVIFENEFADISIDGELLKESQNENNQELNIWEFSNGCVCCNMKGDFTNSLVVISNSLDPDFLIVEPSGIGVLSSIIKEIKKIEYDRIQLLEPITIIDAKAFEENYNKFNDLLIDQIKNAKHIQLSKIEQHSLEELEYIKKEILKINKNANIYIEHYKNQNIDYWNNLFNGELKTTNEENSDININLENMSYNDSVCRDLGTLINFLELLVRGYYGDINRAKGVFKIQDYFVRFDVVNGQYAITLAEESAVAQSIFIGQNINRLFLKKKLSYMKNNNITINIK